MFIAIAPVAHVLSVYSASNEIISSKIIYANKQN